MKPTVTPLRYPGGKTWLLPYINDFLKFHKIQLGTIIEPFAGSASVSVGLLKSGIADNAVLCENDPMIISFWKSALYSSEEFVELIKNTDISMDTWYEFKKYLANDAPTKYSDLEIGFAFLFYNRTNYSGIITAGPIGGRRQLSKYSIKCRFNPERIIKKVSQLSALNERIEIIHGDGNEYLRKFTGNQEENIFIYVDPPYYDAGKVLYRKFFAIDDHMELEGILTHINSPWLASYDDVNFIRNLYKSSKSQYVYTDYQAGNLKRGSRELLLSNLKIPPITAKLKTSNHKIENVALDQQAAVQNLK
jgi:DNA adenine methylase